MFNLCLLRFGAVSVRVKVSDHRDPNQSSEEPVPGKWQCGWIRVLRHFGYIRSASPTDVVVDDQDLNYRLAVGLRDLFDSDSDSNKNTHLCHDVFSLASICYVH